MRGVGGETGVSLAAMSLTKPQKKVLSTLRAILRHVNTHFDNRTGTLLKKDVRPWTSEIMATYRANQHVKGREEVRQLRTAATDLITELTSVHEQRVRGGRGRVVTCGWAVDLPCLWACVAGPVLPVRRPERGVHRVPHRRGEPRGRHHPREDPAARIRQVPVFPPVAGEIVDV